MVKHSSKGLPYFFSNFGTKAQLDLARTALKKTRDFLRGCDKDTIQRALKVNDSLAGITQVLHRLDHETAELRVDINLMAGCNHNLGTAFKARRIRSKSENLQRRAKHFSEGVWDIVEDDDELRIVFLEKQQERPDQPNKTLPPGHSKRPEHSEHAAAPLTVENQAIGVETISKLVHEVALTAAPSLPSGNLMIIQHSTIHQNSSISHSSLNQVGPTNSTPLYACPYCSTQFSFDSRTDLATHMSEVHEVRKRKSVEETKRGEIISV